MERKEMDENEWNVKAEYVKLEGKMKYKDGEKHKTHEVGEEKHHSCWTKNKCKRVRGKKNEYSTTNNNMLMKITG